MIDPPQLLHKKRSMMPGSVRNPRRKRNRIRHQRFEIGEQVRFADGTLAGTGVVDAITADYSIIWIWTDGGSGRKMFLQGLGAIVESVQENPGVPGEIQGTPGS